MRPVELRSKQLGLFAFLPLFWGCVTGVPSDFSLSEANYASVREQVLPKQSELRWTQIPWRPSFHEGVAEAQVQGKPVLLWVMNGHPLGCT